MKEIITSEKTKESDVKKGRVEQLLFMEEVVVLILLERVHFYNYLFMDTKTIIHPTNMLGKCFKKWILILVTCPANEQTGSCNIRLRIYPHQHFIPRANNRISKNLTRLIYLVQKSEKLGS